METYRTEDDQIDAIKRWWEKNGKFLIIGLIFIFAGVVGGGVWKDYKQTAQFSVSNEFDVMMQELRDEKMDAALKRGGQLVDKHKDSHYAIMTSLAMAKIEVEKGNLDAAKLRLTWALDNNDKPSIEHIIRLRLIRVLIATGKLDEALTLAMQGNMSDFASEYSIIKGDIYRAQGESEQARNAYRLAIQSDGATPQTKQLVQLKLDDLGDTSHTQTTSSVLDSTLPSPATSKPEIITSNTAVTTDSTQSAAINTEVTTTEAATTPEANINPAAVTLSNAPLEVQP